MLNLLKITKSQYFSWFNKLCQADSVFYQYSTTFNSKWRRLVDIWIDLKHLSGCQGVMLCPNIAEVSENENCRGFSNLCPDDSVFYLTTLSSR